MVVGVVGWIVLMALVGWLAWWWWQLGDVTPRPASIARASAIVVDSPSCGGDAQGSDAQGGGAQGGGAQSDGDGTTVELTGGGGSKAVLDGCGFPAGTRIDVEYDRDSPQRVWLAGATPVGQRSVIGTVAPLVIAGGTLVVLAVGGVVILRRYRRHRRHGDTEAGPVSVAELMARIGADRGDSDPQSDDPDRGPIG